MNKNKDFLSKLDEQFQNSKKNGGATPFEVWKQSCKAVDKDLPNINGICILFTTKNGSDYLNFNDQSLTNFVGMAEIMRSHLLHRYADGDSDN